MVKPSRRSYAISAIDAGVPAVLQAPRSKLSQSIEELAAELLKITDQSDGAPAPGDSESELPRTAAK